MHETNAIHALSMDDLNDEIIFIGVLPASRHYIPKQAYYYGVTGGVIEISCRPKRKVVANYYSSLSQSKKTIFSALEHSRKTATLPIRFLDLPYAVRKAIAGITMEKFYLDVTASGGVFENHPEELKLCALAGGVTPVGEAEYIGRLRISRSDAEQREFFEFYSFLTADDEVPQVLVYNYTENEDNRRQEMMSYVAANLAEAESRFLRKTTTTAEVLVRDKVLRVLEEIFEAQRKIKAMSWEDQRKERQKCQSI